jgi:lipopolysaccharide assembly outer membrane protein LptD (OstA)
MKILLVATLTLGMSAAAFSFADTVGADKIRFEALNQTSNGPLRTLQDSVRIETSHIIIQADKATVNTDTLDIQPTGNVHIALKR